MDDGSQTLPPAGAITVPGAAVVEAPISATTVATTTVAATAAAAATATATGVQATGTPFRLGNRPPLTGIRALLMIPVVVYHSNFKTLPGAWVPLQVFFVLSGFLITAMLDSEGRRNGRISLKGFYSRRVVRLVPPLLVTVALMAVYASFVHVADASQRIWGDSAAALFYSDYRQALGHAPFFGFLAQTWSLSVEENFYVIWSVLIVAAFIAHRRRLAYVFSLAGIAFSVADRLWLVYGAPHYDHAVFTRVYYAFDSRADAMFLGCLLGLLANDGCFSHWRPWATRLLSVAAVGSSAFLIWILLTAPLWQEQLLVWWLPLSTIASAIILVYFVIRPRGWGSRFVGIAPLVFLGELSYTVYLVHFPVFLAIQPNGTGWGFWPTELLRLAIIATIAVASWFLIEKPLMRWRQRSAAR
ncbi:MAG: acyltransferase family protein [Acidimicrobiales bacterium]